MYTQIEVHENQVLQEIAEERRKSEKKILEREWLSWDNKKWLSN